VFINEVIQAVLKNPKFNFTMGEINFCSYRSHITPTSDQINFEVKFMHVMKAYEESKV